MSGKPRKNKKKKPSPVSNKKQAIEEFDLTKGEFMTLGMLQQTVESAQKAQSVFLSNLAGSRWGYAEDVQLGFAINWEDGKVKVAIQRESDESVQSNADDDTMKSSTK